MYEWEQHGIIHQPPVIVAEEGKVLPPLAPKSLYKIVSEHKDVTKVNVLCRLVLPMLFVRSVEGKFLSKNETFKSFIVVVV